MKIFTLFKSITIFEIVLTMVVSVALGISFWGWTFLYEVAQPFLKAFGLGYLMAGFWIFVSVFVSQIVRKPGIAIIASVVAAFVQGLLTKWGIMSILWGTVQGVGAEMIFMLFLYRKWDLKGILLATVMSTVFSYCLDFGLYGYRDLSFGINIIQISAFIISSIVFAGFLSHLTAQRLLKLGLLDQFLIGKNAE